MGHRKGIQYIADGQPLHAPGERLLAMTPDQYQLMKAKKAAKLAARRKNNQENPKKKGGGPNKHPRR